MKHLSASFTKLLAVVACALTLGGCNRGEYAQLPKADAYHGTARVRAAVPLSPAAEVPTTVAEPAAAVAQVPTAQPAETMAAQSPIKSTPATAAPSVAAQPEVARKASALAATGATARPEAKVAKPNLAERMLAHQLNKKLDKLSSKVPMLKQATSDPTAKSGISGNIKLGIILMVIGAIVALLPGLFRLLGLIIFIVGLLFLLLALLDMV